MAQLWTPLPAPSRMFLFSSGPGILVAVAQHRPLLLLLFVQSGLEEETSATSFHLAHSRGKLAGSGKIGKSKEEMVSWGYLPCTFVEGLTTYDVFSGDILTLGADWAVCSEVQISKGQFTPGLQCAERRDLDPITHTIFLNWNSHGRHCLPCCRNIMCSLPVHEQPQQSK